MGNRISMNTSSQYKQQVPRTQRDSTETPWMSETRPNLSVEACPATMLRTYAYAQWKLDNCHGRWFSLNLPLIMLPFRGPKGCGVNYDEGRRRRPMGSQSVFARSCGWDERTEVLKGRIKLDGNRQNDRRYTDKFNSSEQTNRRIHV